MNAWLKQERSPKDWYYLLKSGVDIGQVGWQYYQAGRNWWKARNAPEEFFLTLTEEDEDIWWWARRWVLSQVGETLRTSVEVVTLDRKLVEVPNSDTVAYPIEFNGQWIKVVIRKPNRGESDDDDNTPVGSKYDIHDRMIFTLNSVEQRNDLIAFLETLYPQVDRERLARVFRSRGSVGGWKFVRHLRHRSPDSLILSGHMLDEIIADLGKFLGDEQAYVDRGIPWHRGYLLYGPPGTGKSSLIATIADHLGRDVHFMSLKNIEGDDTLIECVSDMGSNAILALEDVDVVKATHDRQGGGEEAGSKGVSIQGLLNVLDGLLTPHGMITFMTTNHVDELDEALIRPGRADKKYELGYLNQDQLDRMISRFVGPEWAGKVLLERSDATSGEVVECFKASFDYDPAYIVECIRQVAKG